MGGVAVAIMIFSIAMLSALIARVQRTSEVSG